jgi:hypothetical protein
MTLTRQEQGRLLDCLLEMGDLLLDCGAEIGRVEDTLSRMGAAYGAASTDVFVIPSIISISMEFPGDDSLTETRRIHSNGLNDFYRLEKLNSLSRSCCQTPLPLGELRAALDRVAAGQPAVAIDKNLIGDDGKPTWIPWSQDLKTMYIAGDVLEDMRKIENQFCTDLGLPNSNTEKRERMSTAEISVNDNETYCTAAMWLEELQRGCKKASDMFGIELSVDWRFKPNEGGDPDADQTVDQSMD